MSRVLIVNEDFVPSQAFVNDYVNTKDSLPYLLNNILADYDVDSKRIEVYQEYPYLQEFDDEESRLTLELLKQGKKSEAEDLQIQLVLDFLDKYPQFKPLILGVESVQSSFIKKILKTIREAFVGEF